MCRFYKVLLVIELQVTHKGAARVTGGLVLPLVQCRTAAPHEFINRIRTAAGGCLPNGSRAMRGTPSLAADGLCTHGQRLPYVDG